MTPIDKEAPKGRLILPQVQTIRDLLDNDAIVLVVKERELGPALKHLKEPPALVVTDSQAFLKVSADTPPAVPHDLVLDSVRAAEGRPRHSGPGGGCDREQLRPGTACWFVRRAATTRSPMTSAG